MGRLPRSLAYQAGLAVVGQTSCRLQVHIPADVQVCWQAPTKHSSVKPAGACVRACVRVCVCVCEPASQVLSQAKAHCCLPPCTVLMEQKADTHLSRLCLKFTSKS